ncbi:MAG TPA: succinate dehydrogenase cytochrome b subunit [Bryobacteraceae bacterium]|jgi:succinate dehydrogenase / fumarate reductase cytochrome b subunit|nr:succinate dehydrogenase cytochrome b subunit [Bryobacteraceae bacterium]
MSSIAVRPIHRAVRFYDAPIGKKAVMAVTGVVLFIYVIAHLAGNLQIFASDPQQINRYAAMLHSPTFAGPLWTARAILIACVVLHIVSAVQLTLQNRAARPVSYYKKADVPSAYAARTMIWSGIIIAAFVVFHILQLTTGSIPGLPANEIGPNQPDARANVIHGFQNPWVSGFYILALVLLCTHLYHGIWSMFQSLGISHPKYTPGIKRGAAIVAIALAVGYISIPVAVLTGVLSQ